MTEPLLQLVPRFLSGRLDGYAQEMLIAGKKQISITFSLIDNRYPGVLADTYCRSLL
jgi:hypothetical protein